MPPEEESEAIAKVEEGVVTDGDDGSGMRQRLSGVSKKYDIKGRGQLDSTELAMRRMDSQDLGYISNEKVYELLKEQTTMQKKILDMKRLLIAAAVFIVILALANMGTAFAAATLAKDTTSSNGQLVDAKTGQALSTEMEVHSFPALEIPMEGNSTRLLTSDGKDGKGDSGGAGGEEGEEDGGGEVEPPLESGFIDDDTGFVISGACVEDILTMCNTGIENVSIERVKKMEGRPVQDRISVCTANGTYKIMAGNINVVDGPGLAQSVEVQNFDSGRAIKFMRLEVDEIMASRYSNDGESEPILVEDPYLVGFSPIQCVIG